MIFLRSDAVRGTRKETKTKKVGVSLPLTLLNGVIGPD